jgi:hypothetical protein
MKDMDDPDAIAVALFNGFVWDAAVKVMGHD